MLGEDELSIHLDIENATPAGNQLRSDVVALLDPGRQTGSLRFVVSTRAIGNSDDHSGLQISIMVHSTAGNRALDTIEALEALEAQTSSTPLGARCFMNPNI